MIKIKEVIKSDEFKEQLSAWSLTLFTGGVFGLGAFILGAPWWLITLIVLFGGLIFWFCIVFLIFIIWGIVGD